MPFRGLVCHQQQRAPLKFPLLGFRFQYKIIDKEIGFKERSGVFEIKVLNIVAGFHSEVKRGGFIGRHKKKVIVCSGLHAPIRRVINEPKLGFKSGLGSGREIGIGA